MRFVETALRGAYLVEIEPVQDERGFFARSWCAREFAGYGLALRPEQCNISFNASRGTLRGLHYQVKPHAEAKLVRCTAGAMFDVIVDLRADSPTFLQWHGIELSASNRRMLFVPEDFAHGFQTLADDTEVFYLMSHDYHPDSARGIRWDDPGLGIRWPVADPILSARDLDYEFIGR